VKTCAVCGIRADTTKIYDYANETEVEVCPSCRSRIAGNNELVTNSILFGCMGVIAAFATVITILLIINVK
jgi:hypothetical protein